MCVFSVEICMRQTIYSTTIWANNYVHLSYRRTQKSLHGSHRPSRSTGRRTIPPTSKLHIRRKSYGLPLLSHTSININSKSKYRTLSRILNCGSVIVNATNHQVHLFISARTGLTINELTGVFCWLSRAVKQITRSLASAKRPCDCCIILKSGSYTKAI